MAVFFEQQFDKADGAQTPPAGNEYERCIFTGCDFSNAECSEAIFLECECTNCNFSMATLENTALRDVQFGNCKMLGLRFEVCNEFGFAVSFDNCTLRHSSFFRMKLQRTVFRNCDLQDVDFSGCDLSGAVFDNCNLARAVFENTILEKADFRTAVNYSIDPSINRIKKARFALPGVVGLLDACDIEIEL